MYKKRVAAYIRVGGDSGGQYAKRQAARREREIKSREDWEFAGVYMDTGACERGEEFLRLTEDCKRGKIDLIITPTALRFGRNLVDAMNTVRGLYLQTPRVGVIFEKENLNSLDGDNGVPTMMFLHDLYIAQSRRKRTAYAAAMV